MRKYKVLLVDDEPDIIEFLSYNFAKYGFEVTTASDGEQGLEQAAASRPDVIVSDILMPKLSGVKMCEKMKQQEALRNVPFIFLSATPDDLVALTALDAGGDKFMSKPVRLPVLFDAVERLLERYSFRHY